MQLVSSPHDLTIYNEKQETVNDLTAKKGRKERRENIFSRVAYMTPQICAQKHTRVYMHPHTNRALPPDLSGAEPRTQCNCMSLHPTAHTCVDV